MHAPRIVVWERGTSCRPCLVPRPLQKGLDGLGTRLLQTVLIMSAATAAKSTRFLIGRVIGTKMRKTAKVCVTRMTLHPHVLKYVSKRKTVFAHDEEEECTDGDLVMIGECQRISNQKHFKVWRILEKADSYTDPNTGKTHYRTPYWFADADH